MSNIVDFLRDLLLVTFGVIAALLIAGLIVLGLDAVMTSREQRQSPTEINFRAACAAKNGITVWNSRHWECLK